MKIVIGGDHAGFPLKRILIPHLEEAGHDVLDVGPQDESPVDFPDMVKTLCQELLAGQAERGILCCGTGVGASMASNRIRGIRAALCHDTHCAHQSVEHDNANILCMGNWIVGEKLAIEIVDTFIRAEFIASEDHVRRIAKLEALLDWQIAPTSTKGNALKGNAP